MARPLRVAHVVQSLGHGGAEHFVVDLANAQRAAGLAVEIAEVGSACGPAGAGATVPVTLVRKEGRARALRRLARWLREVGPDVVHTHTFTGLLYGHAAARLAHVPAVVATYHSSGAPGSLYGPWQRVVDGLLRRADAVVVFSEEQRAALADRLGRDIDVVPNGVPLTAAGTDRAKVRADLGVAGDDVLVLAVGGLREQKDYPLLLDALALGVAENIAVRIVGDGAERAALERRARELGSVELLGHRDDARALLAAADVLVNTSRWESMPVAVLEAMAAGCAVVVPDVGNLREVVDGAGLLVDRTPAAVADGLRTLAADADLRSRLGAAGQERVRAAYSIEQTADRYLAVYGRR